MARLSETPIPDAGEILFASNDVLRLPVCSAGEITFSARGTIGGGFPARLVVAHGTTTLFDEGVDARREIRIQIPGPGWLLLAFVNDYYVPPEDRNLWIYDFQFEPES